MLKSMAWILPIYLKYQAYAPTSAPLRHPSEGRVDLAGDPRGGPHGQHLACLALANRRHPQRNHAPWQRSQPLRRAHAGLQRHRLRLPHHRAAVARTRVARRCRLRPRHQPQGQCDERGGRRQRRASGRHAIPPGYPAQQRNRRSVISRSQYRPHSPPRSKNRNRIRSCANYWSSSACSRSSSRRCPTSSSGRSTSCRAPCARRRRWARAPRPTFRSRPRTNSARSPRNSTHCTRA